MIETKVLTVKNPRWSNMQKKTIDCDITTNTLKQEVPFTASPYDNEEYGRDIYFRCLNNEFGPVAEPLTSEQFDWNTGHPLPAEFTAMRKFLDYANAENSKGASRGIAIVWASYLESELIQLLRNWFEERPQEKKPKRFCFEQVIDNAFSVKLISESDKNKYHAIRKIRNRAAHDWDFSLDSRDDVKDNLKSLYKEDHNTLIEYHEDLDFLIRHVYSGSCGILAMKLLNLKLQQT